MISVRGFDHLVLRCMDVEITLEWYTGRLGLAPVRLEEWRAGDVPFPSLRVNDDTIIDLLPSGGLEPGFRLDHICLVVDAASVEAVVAADDLPLIDGPGPRFGARGVATSVYIQDPDGLTVELRAYPTP